MNAPTATATNQTEPLRAIFSLLVPRPEFVTCVANHTPGRVQESSENPVLTAGAALGRQETFLNTRAANCPLTRPPKSVTLRTCVHLRRTSCRCQRRSVCGVT